MWIYTAWIAVNITAKNALNNILKKIIQKRRKAFFIVDNR